MVNQVIRKMAIDLPLREVFRHQTIRGLSDWLLTREIQYDRITPAPKQKYYPLSSAQQRMYFLQQFDPGSVAYNISHVGRLIGQLELQQLRNVFDQLIERHESLRTRFVLNGEEPMQEVLEQVSFEVDYEVSSKDEVTSRVAQLVQPFDLSEGPLIRASLIRLGEDEHLLFVDMHHIITDGVSLGVLIRDFMSLYQGQPLPSLELNYKDFVVWQQRSENLARLEAHKTYWLSVFTGELNTLELPMDRPRPLQVDESGKSFDFAFDRDQTQALHRLAQQAETTPYVVLLSIFGILLSKLSGQEDFQIGTPVAGREHPDVEHMIGMFVNTVVLRMEPNKTYAYLKYLAEVKTHVLDGFEHQAYPYEDLIDLLEVPRNTSRNPLFDVMFAYEDFGYSEVSVPGLSFEPFEGTDRVAQFDLTLTATASEAGLQMSFDYASALFDETTIKRFAKYFKKISAAILSNQEILIQDIDLLSSEEYFQLLEDFNPEVRLLDESDSIVRLIEQQAQRNATNIALYYEDSVITYDTLNTQANRLAHYLVDQANVNVGEVIGLHLGRTPRTIVALIAALKVGATYLYLDPESPSDRIIGMIADAGVDLIVSDQSEELPLEVSTLHLLRSAHVIEEMPSGNLALDIPSDMLAYLIYTSGSTGKPKGVQVTRKSLLDYSLTFQAYFGLDDTDRVIQQATLSFDTSVEEIFPALISGAALVIAPYGGRDIHALSALIEQQQATLLSTVPAVLNELNLVSEKLSSLKTIISGGELLLPEHIDHLLPNHDIYNSYGPSESTVCITYHHIENLSETSLLGKPITNRQVYIVNADLQLCPIGVAGELCVSGEGLSPGYLNQENLTASKFIENPFKKGTMLYRTGDQVKWRRDGTLEFLGRLDDQVKLRGQRVELGEIDAKILGHELVTQAVTQVKSHEGEKYLVAYYVSSQPVDADELRGYLAQKLPAYMVPNVMMPLESLPLTSSGKLDKKALPEPKEMLMASYEAPSGDLEINLVKIWSEVLKVDAGKVGVATNFFALGGNSLKAVWLTKRIQEVLQLEVPLQKIFERQDIRSLADYLTLKAQTKSQSGSLVRLNEVDTTSSFFIIHDGSGGLGGYMDLISTIKAYNCYGITFEDTRQTNVRELSTAYLDQITKVQPSGPIRLLGWSTGGVIAQEIARQWEERGEEVAQLIVIDTYFNFDKPVSISPDLDQEVRQIKSLLPQLVLDSQEFSTIETLWETVFETDAFQSLTKEIVLKHVPTEWVALIPDTSHLSLQEMISSINQMRKLDLLVEQHVIAGEVKGPTLYVKPEQSSQAVELDKLAVLHPQMVVKIIDGDHFSVMKAPGVKALGALIELENSPVDIT